MFILLGDRYWVHGLLSSVGIIYLELKYSDNQKLIKGCQFQPLCISGNIYMVPYLTLFSIKTKNE